ncbi:MAG: SLBB domain-containing protein [Bdellovibrionota bacterium]
MSRLNRFTSWLVLAALLGTQAPLSAIASTKSGDESESSAEPSDLSLAPGFLIKLSSAQDPTLNGTFRIQADAKVDLPYNTTVSTRTMDFKRFKAAIDRAYQPYFRGHPDLEVTVEEKRYYVDARGLVEKPGSFLVKRDTPLDEVISLAGGLSKTGGQTPGFARIEQGGKTTSLDLSEYFKRGKTQNLVWNGGDRIFFQKDKPDTGSGEAATDEFARKVQVIGEVRSPGELQFRKNADAYYYLLKTGGPTQFADLETVELVRVDSKSGSRESISTGSISDLKTIGEGDVLIVHPKEESKSKKTLETVAIVTSIVAAVALAAVAVISLTNQ